MEYHYQVKFEDPNGNTVYGIAERFGREAEQARKHGDVIVTDIRGDLYMVPEEYVTDIPIGDYRKIPEEGRFAVVDDEYARYLRDEYRAARERSDSLPDDGALHVGALVQIGVGDGYAYYVVESISGGHCTVSWRGFEADRYIDPWLGYGCVVETERVNALFQFSRSVAKIFDGSR